jgi:hypothetical protein
MTINTIYDGIKYYIQNNLENYLQPDGDVTAPMFKSILRSSVYDILGLKLYPALMMEYGRIEAERATTTSDFYTLPITFYCISSGGDTEKLQALSEIYVWALKNMFEKDPSLGGIVDNCSIIAYEFSPSLPRNTGFVHVGLLYTGFEITVLKNKEDR